MTQGQLFGSVNARDISEVVTEAGFTVTRQQVISDNPVKALGFHEFRVRLHPEVEATVTANVARSEEEAEIQAKLGRAIVGDDEEEQQDDGVEEVAPDAAELLEPEALEAIEAPPMKKLTMHWKKLPPIRTLQRAKRKNPIRISQGFCSRILMKAFRLGAPSLFLR